MKEEERVPLSSREYYALRALFGIVSTASLECDTLKKRLKLIPNGWRDMRLMLSISERLMGSILQTIPSKKLAQIRRELDLTVVEVKVSKPFIPSGDGLTCIPEAALDRLTSRVMGNDCFLCDKCGADVKKCQVRKDLEALYHFDFPRSGDCPFAGAEIERTDENHGN